MFFHAKRFFRASGKDEVYVLDRTIDVNITRLRKKIDPYGKNIVTRLGFGYCFEG